MRRIVVFAAVLGLVGMLSVPASAEATLDLTLRVGRIATLGPEGGTVLVRVFYTCSSDVTSTDLSMYAFERVGGNRMAVGYGAVAFEDLVCDSERHSAVASVEAFERPFRKGVAIVRAEFYACNEGFVVCDLIRTSREIEIVKP